MTDRPAYTRAAGYLLDATDTAREVGRLSTELAGIPKRQRSRRDRVNTALVVATRKLNTACDMADQARANGDAVALLPTRRIVLDHTGV